ncbi:TPA: transposase [Legionella pneumophila]|nr:transposase [Legionella pneumophila]HAU9905903.1 transposase [Legionella pneumophila]HAU9927349.1 transposase [Legionella pneumophila]HAU9930282.1 transposase [Legionella pneumophila]HAU9939572.1 transposase [Legionella pneumophila]
MKQLVDKNIHIVTMMKRNAVAYFPPIKPTQSKRGRPAKYGPQVKLFSLFDSDPPYRRPSETGVFFYAAKGKFGSLSFSILGYQ